MHDEECRKNGVGGRRTRKKHDAGVSSLKRQRKRAGNAVDKSIPTGFRHHGLVWVEDESESWLAAEPLDDSSLESGEVDCVFC